MVRTRSGRGGRGGRGAQGGIPIPQVQEVEPMVQEEVQNNPEDVPIIQEAETNVAEAPTPTMIAQVQPNEARNQVPAIFNCKFELHPYIYDARFTYRISEKRTLRFGYSKHETNEHMFFLHN